MSKYFTPIAVVLAGLFIAGAIFMTGGLNIGQSAGTPSVDNTGSQAEQKAAVEFTVTKEDHVRGNFEAAVTIVEFSDFQCPFCQRFHPTVQQALNEYPDQVRLVYKHFPLDAIHPQARPSAEASECAAEQGKFWEFADGLFENQPSLGESFYKELASDLSLDMDQFEGCLSSRKYKDHVEADYQEGIKAGVRGTPGSFVNGEAVSGAVPYATLKAAIERALNNL